MTDTWDLWLWITLGLIALVWAASAWSGWYVARRRRQMRDDLDRVAGLRARLGQPAGLRASRGRARAVRASGAQMTTKVTDLFPRLRRPLRVRAHTITESGCETRDYSACAISDAVSVVELIRGLNLVGLTLSNDPTLGCLVIHPAPDTGSAA